MDFLIKHFAPLPRLFPSSMNIISIGYLKKKRHWIDNQFDTCNFSFILSGSGEYHYRGQILKVKSPCVITQTPDIFVEYGPTGISSCWEELYLVYSGTLLSFLRQNNFIREDRPIWSINDYAAFTTFLFELDELVSSTNSEGVVDRIDRTCENLILESLAGEPRKLYGEIDEQIQKARAFIRNNFKDSIDFDQLARIHGMSPASFRRHWLSRIGKPPARFQTNLRMQEACRLLVETRIPIGQIAYNIGFNDPLYFSRKFSRDHQMSPSEYRKTYQSGISWLSEI